MCFGGKLLRGNRTQKVNSSSYQAFATPTYPPLATLGVNVDWAHRYLLQASTHLDMCSICASPFAVQLHGNNEASPCSQLMLGPVLTLH